MERASVESRRSRSTPWFEDNRSTYQHHAEYLKKLSNLREELISQEQTHLANALDRLRMRHNGKENLFSRNRLRDVSSESYQRKSLLTTSEQFQKLRPKKAPPHISPLEGKQLLEPQTYRSDRSQQFNEKHSTSPTRALEEKLRANLQKIIQPTSSIPNIGRKSTGKSKDLVLQSSSIQRKRYTKGVKEDLTPSPETNPFKAVHKRNGSRLRSLVRPDSDELDLTPQAVKFEHLSDKDRLSLEKLKEYYCIYYLPNNSPVPPEEEDRDTPRTETNVTINTYEEHIGFDCEKRKRISLLEGKSIFPQSSERNSVHAKKERDTQRSRNARSHDGLESSAFGAKIAPSRKQIIVDMPDIVFNAATPLRTKTKTV